METTYLEKDLPVDDFKKLGLYRDGKITLKDEDLQALLAGRRTALIGLKDLQGDGVLIERIDAKLSLESSPEGKLVLKGHPIYKEVQPHAMLTEHEAAILADGSISSISKTYLNPPDQSKTYIIEYDEETKEFVSYQPENVQAPEQVNGETLTEKQKKAFKNGELVTLSDGTNFQHRASERNGLLADRTALVLSVLLDGGISYLLITGIRMLIGARDQQKDAYTDGYQAALKDMEAAQRKTGNQSTQQQQQGFDDEPNRGYGRRTSR